MTRRIDVLIFPGFQILDAAGPIAAFEIAARFSGGAYALRVIAADPGPVESSSGAALLAGAFPETPPDTLMIAGGDGTRDAGLVAGLAAPVRALAAGARRTASVCSGAFILAEAGLLDGRRATTHWNRCAGFARSYPRVKVEPDRIWVRDGDVWTSAGISAGIDLALALIADDLGEALARDVARQLVLPHRRAGGQSQFSAVLETQKADGRFAALLDWARTRLDQALTVEDLAARACMSPRHFARAFTAETGSTPAKAIERLRLDAARALVEADTAPLDAIARSAGFNDPERMRRAFVRVFGHPPQALRRAARGSGVAGA